MRADERDALRKAYQFRCGYCGVSEQDVGAELTVDHFQLRSQGGVHEAENWVYCCPACNVFKGDYWAPDSLQRVLHPQRDDLAVHIVERDDGTLVGLTETGTFHADRLRLNREPLVAYRRERLHLAAAREMQAQLITRLEEFEVEIRSLMARLESLEQDADI